MVSFGETIYEIVFVGLVNGIWKCFILFVKNTNQQAKQKYMP